MPETFLRDQLNEGQESGFDFMEAGAAQEAEAKKYLTFYIDSQVFAIPSSQVIDIIKMQTITYMPRLPDFIKGIINLRGKIVPVIDIRLKFHKEEKPYDERTCIVVVEAGECHVGCIVDRVNDVADVAAGGIHEPPRFSDASADYISGVAKVGSATALFLDIGKIIEEEKEEPSISI